MSRTWQLGCNARSEALPRHPRLGGGLHRESRGERLLTASPIGANELQRPLNRCPSQRSGMTPGGHGQSLDEEPHDPTRCGCDRSWPWNLPRSCPRNLAWPRGLHRRARPRLLPHRSDAAWPTSAGAAYRSQRKARQLVRLGRWDLRAGAWSELCQSRRRWRSHRSWVRRDRGGNPHYCRQLLPLDPRRRVLTAAWASVPQDP
jgi:hypothetical protein